MVWVDLEARLYGKLPLFGDMSFLFLDEVHEMTDTMLQILAVLRCFPPSKQTFGVSDGTFPEVCGFHGPHKSGQHQG